MADDDLVLSYLQPAQEWVEALQIGAGRLGAMVFGGVGTERLQLNDDTLWSGEPRDWDNPHASAVLPETLPDERLADLIEDFDARQVLHVTFGSVLTAFRPRMFTLLRARGGIH